MSPQLAQQPLKHACKDPKLSPASHTPPSESPLLPDKVAPEGENHAPNPDSQPDPDPVAIVHPLPSRAGTPHRYTAARRCHGPTALSQPPSSNPTSPFFKHCSGHHNH